MPWAYVINDLNGEEFVDLVKNTDYNTKINEIEKRITDHNNDKYILKNSIG